MVVATHPLKKLARVYQAKMQKAKELLKKGDVFHSSIAIAEAELIAENINELSRIVERK
ncbi:MAG: DUF6435 family protein [Bacteroidia bacterium]